MRLTRSKTAHDVSVGLVSIGVRWGGSLPPCLSAFERSLFTHAFATPLTHLEVTVVAHVPTPRVPAQVVGAIGTAAVVMCRVTGLIEAMTSCIPLFMFQSCVYLSASMVKLKTLQSMGLHMRHSVVCLCNSLRQSSLCACNRAIFDFRPHLAIQYWPASE